MRIVLTILAALLAAAAHADRTVTVQWNAPTHDCDGNELDPATIARYEVYVSQSPIPGPTDACDTADPVDPPPGVAPIEQADGTATSVTFPLPEGHWYLRMRVQVQGVDSAGDPVALWSGLSNQEEKTVLPLEPPIPNPPEVVVWQVGG